MKINNDQKDYLFSLEAKNNFSGLAVSLKKIHIRLISEGYTIANSQIIPPSRAFNK